MKNYSSIAFQSKREPGDFIQTCVGIMLLVFFLQTSVQAQRVVTLAQAITNGLENKNAILAGNLDAAISKLQTKALYQKYLPQVAVEYQYLYNPILQTSILPIGVFNPSFPIDATKSVQFGTNWTQAAGLTVSLPVFDLAIKRQIKEAKLQEQIAALSQQQAEYELAYTIAQTYIAIYLQEAKIKSLVIDTSRTFTSYTLLKSKFDEKRLLKSDLNKAKVNHNNTVQLVTDGIALLLEDKVYLLFLMGTKETTDFDFELDATFSEKLIFENTDSEATVAYFPDLQQLQFRSALTQLQTKSERAKRLPTIGLKGYLGANQFSNTFNPTASNSWFGLSYVGLDVKLPILFGENPRNKIAQLKMQSKQFDLQKDDKALQYATDLVTLKLKFENVKSQLKTKEENIAISSESIFIFQMRVREGQESALNLNLEEAAMQLLQSDFELNKMQLWIYWLDFLKASGQLTTLWK